MKNRLFNIVLLVAFIGVNGYFIFDHMIFKKHAYSQLDEREKYWENKVNVINELQRLSIKGEFTPLSKTSVVQDLDNRKFNMRDLVGKSNMLVFCIPEAVCNVCYDSLYATFDVMSKEIGTSNLAILVPQERLREMYSQFSESVLKDRLFGISSKELGLEIQGAYLPYLFVMDSSLVCRNLYLPHKSEQTMTNFYLATVKDRYFVNHDITAISRVKL